MTGPESSGGRGLIADPIHRYLLYVFLIVVVLLLVRR